jgi:putative transcriptional regulator
MGTFKDIRERLGLTQGEMAEALGCSQGNVSLLDRGQTVLPDMAKKLIAFAATKGVVLTYEDVYGPVRLPRPAKKRAPTGESGREAAGGAERPSRVSAAPQANGGRDRPTPGRTKKPKGKR